MPKRRKRRGQPNIAPESALENDAGEVTRVRAPVVDITQEKRLLDALRSLVLQLMHLRDEELRRIALQLNLLNQYHAAITLNLDRMTRPETTPEQAADLAAQSLKTLQRGIVETQSLAGLLHPQALDKAGFGAAATGYADAFTRRTGITVDLKLPPRPKRFSSDAEMALFRVLEEALSNVYRHSRASKVDVVLEQHANRVILTVRDYGRSMTDEQLRLFREPNGDIHLGLASLRERVAELGGQLTVKAENPGTRLRASLPISHRTTVQA